MFAFPFPLTLLREINIKSSFHPFAVTYLSMFLNTYFNEYRSTVILVTSWPFRELSWLAAYDGWGQVLRKKPLLPTSPRVTKD